MRGAYRMVTLCALVIGLSISAPAQTVNLDAPVVRVVRAPTIRSEIRRGEHDATSCILDAKDNTDAGQYVICVKNKMEADERDAISSDAYLLGVYVTGISHLNGILTPDVERFHTAVGAKIAAEAKKQWEAHLKTIVASSHLTKSDFCEALPASDLAKCKASPFY